MFKSVFVAAVVLFTCACNQREASPLDGGAETLRAADTALTKAVTSRDLESVASFYADDAILMPTAEPSISGKVAIREEWKHIFGIPGFKSMSALKQVEVSRSGDMGFTRGTYTAQMVGEDGGAAVEPGKWLTVWRKQSDGRWRIVADTYNTDIMPPVHKASTAR